MPGIAEEIEASQVDIWLEQLSCLFKQELEGTASPVNCIKRPVTIIVITNEEKPNVLLPFMSRST